MNYKNNIIFFEEVLDDEIDEDDIPDQEEEGCIAIKVFNDADILNKIIHDLQQLSPQLFTQLSPVQQNIISTIISSSSIISN